MEKVVILLSCHHCDFTHPGPLGGDIMEHPSTESPRCRGASMPSKCFCPGVMRAGCPCSRCHGHGFHAHATDETYADFDEVYCSCADGTKRRKMDGGT